MEDMDPNAMVRALDKLLDYTASGIGAVAGPMLATWRARREAAALQIAAQGQRTRFASSLLPKLDFTQNPGKVMDDITFVRSHWWLVSEGFSLSTANSDVQKLPATLYHRIADSLAYAA